MHTRATLLLLIAASLCGAPALASEKDFLKAAKSNDRPGMVKAAEEIADAPDAKGIKALVTVGALVESIDVYTACREALAKAAQKDDLRGEIVKLLKSSKRAEQKTLCIDGLGGSGHKDAVAAIADALDEKDKAVRISAVQALTRMELKECVPALFERLDKVGFKSKDAEAEELYGSLHKLTGQAFEALEDWRKWWETVQADFDPKQKKGGGADPGTRMREGEGKIFESVVRSQAFVLVLDISSSMRVIDLPEGETWKDPKSGKELKYKDPDPKGTKPPVADSRFVRAQEAFVKFIEGLSERAQFAIVVFADEKETKLWKPDVVQANAGNKKSAIDFVKKLKWSGATRTDLALELAFKVKGADTIYLFSDGIPEKTQGGKSVDIPQDEVLEKARTLNRARKLRLNCYGMTSSGKTREFLTKLASENGGEYQDIRVPAQKKP